MLQLPYTLIIILLLATVVSPELPDIPSLQTFLSGNPDITYKRLEYYFQKKTGVTKNSFPETRLFPLCLNSSSVRKVSKVEKFAQIFEKLENTFDCSKPLPYYKFEKENHSTTHPASWIHKIQLSRINTPDPDVRNLRQWMNIRVTTKEKMEGLYMQTIVGPLGLSSGEFSLEFPCSDIPTTKNSGKFSFLLNCDYRSKAEISHPRAYFGGTGTGSETFSAFHVHFRWTDITCLESPFLQFILIPVKNFVSNPEMGKDFQPQLSPVFTNFDFDSIDGVITPSYMDWWHEMTCNQTSQKSGWKASSALYHDTQFESLKWNESSELFRLPFNDDFDSCITTSSPSKLKKLGRNDVRRECAPGPFKCSEKFSFKSYQDSDTFSDLVDRRKKDFQSFVKTQDCLPCYFPTREEIFGATLCDNSTGNLSTSQTSEYHIYLDYTELLEAPVHGRAHGAVAFLALLVLAPLGNFIGRFYQGTMHSKKNRHDDSNPAGFWTYLHVAFHTSSFFLMWISMGLASSGYEGMINAEHCFVQAKNNSGLAPQDEVMETLGNCITNALIPSAHVVIGSLAFVCQNLVFLGSFFRHSDRSIRNIQVIFHSHGGYLTYLLAVLSVYLAAVRDCADTSTWATYLLALTLIATVVVAVICNSEDELIGIEPRRFQWPILEHVQLLEHGPHHEKKLCMLFTYLFFVVIFWIIAVISISVVSRSERDALGYTGSGNTGHSSQRIRGIFEECEGHVIKIDWEDEEFW